MYSKCAVLLVVLSLGLVASASFTDLFSPSTNAAIRWNHLHFEIIRAAGYPLSPPLTARAMAIVNGLLRPIARRPVFEVDQPSFHHNPN